MVIWMAVIKIVPDLKLKVHFSGLFQSATPAAEIWGVAAIQQPSDL
jgi:hypothetical protein